MVCPTDSSTLLEYLENPTDHAAVAAHLIDCQACRQRLAHLHRLAFQPADHLSCPDAEPALLAWLQDDRAGALAPDVQRHLDGCPACQQTVWQIRQTDQALHLRNLAAPAYVPTPDLAFLQKPHAPLTHWLRQLDQTAQQSASWLLERTGDLQITVRLAFQQLALAPLPVKTAPGQEQPMLRLALTPEPDLNLELVAWPGADSRDEVDVEVLVRRPSQFLQGFAGAAVTLHALGQAHEATTDEDGRVRFSGIPRSGLADLELSTRG